MLHQVTLFLIVIDLLIKKHKYIKTAHWSDIELKFGFVFFSFRRRTHDSGKKS